MQLRSDILRGVRLAAAGLTILLVVLLAKRTINVEATAAPSVALATDAPASVPPAAVTGPVVVPEPPGDSVPALVPKQGALNRAAVKRVKPPMTNASRVELREAAETLSAPPPAEAPVERKELVEPSASTPAASEPAPVAAPAETITVAPPAPEGRGKRILKAVGRFFRGGKKDDPPPLENGKPKQ